MNHIYFLGRSTKTTKLTRLKCSYIVCANEQRKKKQTRLSEFGLSDDSKAVISTFVKRITGVPAIRMNITVVRHVEKSEEQNPNL